MNWLKEKKERVIDKMDERRLKKMEKDIIKLSSFQNQYTLYPDEEKKWYYMTLERVKKMKNKSTVEILHELRPNVQYHPEIKKRMKKQIKLKKTCEKGINDCLHEIMKGYIPESRTKQAQAHEKHQGNIEAVKHSEELIKQPKDDTVPVTDEHSSIAQQRDLRMGEITYNVTNEKITPAIKNELKKVGKKKTVCDEKGETPRNIESDDFCEKCIKRLICNKNKKLLKKYRLREGNEREWVERIKVLMEKQQTKPLEIQLTELMSLVRDHKDIKNAFKTKRMAVRQNKNKESMNKFLDRLFEIYGQNKNKKLNKRIRCHKCKQRGHLRKNCPK